jgi:hypothetical protein
MMHKSITINYDSRGDRTSIIIFKNGTARTYLPQAPKARKYSQLRVDRLFRITTQRGWSFEFSITQAYFKLG